jgi:hypothetical protein
VAAYEAYSERQRGAGGQDLSVEGASDLESGSHGELCVERVLGFPQPNRCEPVRGRGVTGSVSGQPNAVRARPKKSSVDGARTSCRVLGKPDAWIMVTVGAHDTYRGTAWGRRCRLRLPGACVKGVVLIWHKRVTEGQRWKRRSEGVNRKLENRRIDRGAR